MSDRQKHDRERTILVIEAVADPLARQGYRERDADYRLRLLLKGMLRGLGFKCVRVAQDRAADSTTPLAQPGGSFQAGESP